MTRLSLPATFDLPAAAQLADLLRLTNGSIVLNGEAVERVGMAGLQLLLSTQASVQASGHAFGIEHPSKVLSAAASTAGAGRLLSSDR